MQKLVVTISSSPITLLLSKTPLNMNNVRLTQNRNIKFFIYATKLCRLNQICGFKLTLIVNVVGIRENQHHS